MSVENHRRGPNEPCPACGKLFLVSMLEKHIQNVHGGSTKPVKKPTVKKPKRQYIVLESRRGTRIGFNARRRCDNCGRINEVLFYYRRSNFGPVHICEGCKPTVLDRSFGSQDALDGPHVGGLFR